MKAKRSSKAYEKAFARGWQDYELCKTYADNPYKASRSNNPRVTGMSNRQAWINGYSERGDKDFLTLVKLNPRILIGP